MNISRPIAAIAFGVACAAILCSALGATVDGSAAGATATEATVSALWTTKKLTFVFSGFTTKYSCEGLRDKIRQALLTLGARKDLKVREGACSRAGAPEPFPSVDIKMEVLEPAPKASTDTAGAAGSQTPTVAAHWKHIDLILDRDPLWQAEDCELLEQIKHRILPLFASRNLDYQSSCIAHQVSPGGTWLRVEVLVADQTEPKHPPPR